MQHSTGYLLGAVPGLVAAREMESCMIQSFHGVNHALSLCTRWPSELNTHSIVLADTTFDDGAHTAGAWSNNRGMTSKRAHQMNLTLS
jgi:hypothetical protein